MEDAAERGCDVLHDAASVAAGVAAIASDIYRAPDGRRVVAVPVSNGALFFTLPLLAARQSPAGPPA